MKDLHMLPKVRDSWSYLYVEHCRVDQEDKAIAVQDSELLTGLRPADGREGVHHPTVQRMAVG